MLTRDDLKEMKTFVRMSDAMVDSLIPLAEIRTYRVGEIIFRDGDPSQRFFSLKSGKVLLEKKLSDVMTVSVGSVKPGQSFGWSSFIEGGAYTLDAICTDDCEVVGFSKDKLLKLMDLDSKLAHVLTQNLLTIVKNRLDRRTDQLMRVIKNHPDMLGLIDSEPATR
jgi:CRP/FNR family transcriptional regulator